MYPSELSKSTVKVSVTYITDWVRMSKLLKYRTLSMPKIINENLVQVIIYINHKLLNNTQTKTFSVFTKKLFSNRKFSTGENSAEWNIAQQAGPRRIRCT